ncbi:MAG: enolase C-terminal domain-like protein [Leifsonia sp.]
MHSDGRVSRIALSAYSVPTTTFGVAQRESDGTVEWDSTGVLLVEVESDGVSGLGYAYTSAAALVVARDVLAPIVLGSSPLNVESSFWSMARAVRNLGWSGICASAISGVDVALHDLRARMLDVPLVHLLGGARPTVMAYGSGGFTSYGVPELQKQLGGWAEDGLRAVKMKIGTSPADDPDRVAAAREAIGDEVQLFVDANGAYDRKQALGFAERFRDQGVTWFEEPVSSDDLEGLRLLRDRGPAGMQIAAGEYGYTPAYFSRMLGAGAVDTLQADGTRCGGVTGFVRAAALAQAAGIPLSAHTAPALHASLGAALPNVVHVEYFHDHAQIERLFFDGIPVLKNGDLHADHSAPGLGLSLRRADAESHLVQRWDSAVDLNAD